MGKIATATFIDFGLTILFSSSKFIIDPFKLKDNFHVIGYCIEVTKNGKFGEYILTSYLPPESLISITDKTVRILARISVDLGLVIANNLNFFL